MNKKHIGSSFDDFLKEEGIEVSDKVIIDGVDVSGCVRLAIDNISCDLGGECKGWDNCYFKQLQRQKAENEELKKWLEEERQSNEKLRNANNEEYCKLLYIKAENEDLRKYIEKMDKPKIEVVDSDIAIKNIKFKQALEEIREILKPYLTDCQGWLCEAIDETLKKINEVLKDESN